MKKHILNSKSDFADIGLGVTVAETQCVTVKCAHTQKCAITLTPTEIISPYIPNGYMGFTSKEICYCPDGSKGKDFFC